MRSGLIQPSAFVFGNYFFLYPVGQSGFTPVTFLMVFPFTQVIVVFAGATVTATGVDGAGTVLVTGGVADCVGSA